MKILLPYISRSGHSITSNVITGGIEKFSQNLYELFGQNIIPLEITKEDRQNRKTREILEKAYKKHSPDIVWINDVDSVFELSQTRWNIPTIKVIHEPLVRDIRYVNMFDRLYKFWKDGGHLYFVSDNQAKFFVENSIRLSKNSAPIYYKGIINSSFADNSYGPNSTILYNAVTIGRTDKLKDPFYIHRKLVSTDVVTCVVTDELKVHNKPIQQKYSDIHSTWSYPREVKRGLTHKETMKILSQSGCYISTCPNESWGITVMEALCHGVPVILVTDKSGNHSSECIPASEDHYIKVPRNIDKKDLEKIVMDLSKIGIEKRKEISEMTKKKHSKENYKNRLDDIIRDRIIDNNSNDLSNFLC